MRKYSTEFKLEVVQSFLAGDGGAKLLARRWSLHEEKIRSWVSHYRLHGIDGLRPKRSAYGVQFKLQVLSNQDREQLSSRRVAAVYDIRNPNQVVIWRRNLDDGTSRFDTPRISFTLSWRYRLVQLHISGRISADRPDLHRLSFRSHSSSPDLAIGDTCRIGILMREAVAGWSTGSVKRTAVRGANVPPKPASAAMSGTLALPEHPDNGLPTRSTRKR